MVDSLHKVYPDFELSGKSVAEIGSGQFLSHPVGFRVLGAEKIVSFDLYRQFNQKASYMSFSQQVMAKKIYSGYSSSSHYLRVMSEVKSTMLDISKLKQLGVEYRAPFDLLDYDGTKFDLVMSYTVLEHVPPRDIKKLLVKSVEVLMEGGCFCHYIDLEDHLDPEHAPFEFLKERNWADKDCYSRGNRLRLLEWESIFNQVANIEYEFVSILRREASFLPMDISEMREMDIKNKTVSGILAVGKKVSSSE